MSSFFDDGPTSFISRGPRGLGSHLGAGAVIAPKPVSAFGAVPREPNKLPAPINYDPAVCRPGDPWASLPVETEGFLPSRFKAAIVIWDAQPNVESISNWKGNFSEIVKKVGPCSPAQAVAIINDFRAILGLPPMAVPAGSGISRQLPDTSRLRDLDRMAQRGALATRNVLDTGGRNAPSTPQGGGRYAPASDCVSSDRPCPIGYVCDTNPQSKTYGGCLLADAGQPSASQPPQPQPSPPPRPLPQPEPCPAGAMRDRDGNCACPPGTTYNKKMQACVALPAPPPPTPGCPTCPSPVPCQPPTGGGGGGCPPCAPCEKPTVVQSAKNPANWLVVAAAFTMGFMFAMKKKVLAAPLVAGLPDTDD